MVSRAAWLIVVLQPVLQPTAAFGQPLEPGSVLLLDLAAVEVDEAAVASLSTSIAQSISSAEGYSAVALEDIRELFVLKETQQFVGCDEDTACLAELTSQADTKYVLTGSVGRIGKRVVLSLSLVDRASSTPLARESETAETVDALHAVAPTALGRLFGWPGTTTAEKYRLPEGKKVSFAVFGLQATGVPEAVAENLTQIMSVEVKRVEGASVISRADIVAMLQLDEQKAQFGCDDESCVAELGGALGVDKLLVGQVGQLSASYVLTLRLIDARAAKVDNRVTESFQGSEDQLIPAVRHAARELLGVVPEQKGRIAVTASQEQADVWIDNKQMGTLPLQPIADLLPGRHAVRLSKDGFFDWQKDIYVDPGETTVVWSELQERPEKWYQKWWLWASVGVLVVGVTTTTVLLTRPEPTTASGSVGFP